MRRSRIPSHRRDTTFRSGVIVVVVGGLLLYMAFVHGIPFVPSSPGPTIRANFAEASNLNPRTPVRIDGVDVGTVIAETASDGGRNTVVTMSVGSYKADVHSDATATIRMRTFVSGAMYIDLNPGSTVAPRLGNRIIPLRDTSTQVDYDQFTGVATPAVRLEERQVIQGLEATLTDPAGIRNTLSAAPPAITAVGQATNALRGEDIGDLPQLIANSAKAIHAIGADSPSLSAFIDGAEQTFAATTDQSQNLATSLSELPAALASTHTTMLSLNRTIDRLDPLAVALIPGSLQLGPATTALEPMLRTLDATLAQAPPLLVAAPAAFAALARAGRLGTPLLIATNPLTARLNDSIIPWLYELDPNTKLRTYEALGPVAATLDSADGDFDANGYYIRYDTDVNANSVLLPCDVGPEAEYLQQCVVDLPQGLLASIRRRDKR
jgi:virulence factor Mce-like protein